MNRGKGREQPLTDNEFYEINQSQLTKHNGLLYYSYFFNTNEGRK
jgi:hypothetical protein